MGLKRSSTLSSMGKTISPYDSDQYAQHMRTEPRVAGVLGRLRARLNRHGDDQWCPGMGTRVSTAATEYGLAHCPSCPKRVRTEPGPMARYRILGAHTR